MESAANIGPAANYTPRTLRADLANGRLRSTSKARRSIGSVLSKSAPMARKIASASTDSATSGDSAPSNYWRMARA
jgi:hypothetical protein